MSDNSASNRRIAKNTIFLYIRMAFVLIVSLYTTRIVLKVLGVEDYGIYNVVSGFVSMFAFVNTTMSTGIQRFYNFSLGKGDCLEVNKVYNSALLIQVLFAIVAVILLETFGVWYLEHKMVIPEIRKTAARWVYQFTSISLLFVMLQIPYSAAILAHERMDYYAFVSIFDVIAKLGMALAIPYVEGDKLIWYGLFFFSVSLANFLLYFIYCKRNFSEIKVNKYRDSSLFKSMLSFSGWNLFGIFSFMFKSQGSNLLLNSFFGPVLNAANGVATMVSNAVQSFQTNIALAFRPQLVQSYASSSFTRTKVLFYSLSKISYLLLLAIAIPVILEINILLRLWLGDIIPDYTIPFTILSIISLIISALHAPLTQIIHASGRMKTYQIVMGIIISAVVPLSWLFLKLGFSPTSVFYVTIVITLINYIACLFITRTIFPFSLKEYSKKVIIPCLLSTVLIPLIPVFLVLVLKTSLLRFILVCIVDVICSVIVIYCLVLDSAEKAILNAFLRRFKKTSV